MYASKILIALREIFSLSRKPATLAKDFRGFSQTLPTSDGILS